MLSGSSVRSLVHYAARVRPSTGWYASVGSFFGRSAGAVYRTCQRAAHYESHYGYNRYGNNDAQRFVNAYAKAAARFMPRYAPEPKEGASSDAPKKAQNPNQAGGPNKANASGDPKETPEEAKARQKKEQNKARHDAAVEKLKQLRGDPEAETKEGKEGTAVSTLTTGKGYSKDEAKKIVALINKMVPMGFDGDHASAEAALKKYQNYLNGVPARKDGKGNEIPHEQWAAKYAEWLGDMKGVKPPKAAQIPISHIKGVIGKGNRKKTRGDAKHALLKPIGTKQVRGGKVYDAYEVLSTTSKKVRQDATLLRDGDKWYVLKGDGSIERIKRRGGKKGDPVFDPRGILILDPRYKEVALVPDKKLQDVEDIQARVESWISNNPHVKTKVKTSDKRAKLVKKALDKKFKGVFGSNVSVHAEGKNIEITVRGEKDKVGPLAVAVAEFMENNKTYFESVFGDLARGATITVQSNKRVNAGEKGTFRSVVRALRKLKTKTTISNIDIRKLDWRGRDKNPDTAFVKKRLGSKLPDPGDVSGKKVIVKLRYAEGFKPDEKAIEKFLKERYKKKDRDVKVVFIAVDPKPVTYDAAKVTELKRRLKAAYWDGNPGTVGKAELKANQALKRAQNGARTSRDRNRPVQLPLKVDVFEKAVTENVRKQADKMRRKVVGAKGNDKRHEKLLKEYKAWYAVAKDFLGKRADYYKPEVVEKEYPRTPYVGRGRTYRRGPPIRRRRRRRI